MPDTPRYLTKSRYVLGLECPTKLFYANKRDQYADQKFDDRFLRELALGGFQVGELAKCYYPDGIEIESKDYDEAVEQTRELLTRDGVTIFEAAFRHENLFIRADIVVRNGRDLDLIEVKAKSWPPDKGGLQGVRGGINKDYRAKLDDLAFQKYVVGRACPDFNIRASFLFTDKASLCPTDGLHQKFRIKKENGRKRCVVEGELTEADLEQKILCLVPADDVCALIAAEMDPRDGLRTFAEHVEFLALHYAEDRKIAPRPGGVCAKCEFRATTDDLAAGLKSSLHECWSEALGWTADEIDEPNILNLWDCRDKDKFVAAGKIRFAGFTEADIGTKTDDEPGITRTERQWKQIEMARDSVTTPWFDRDALSDEMRRWTFPLHFIDFETSMPAIPFRAGRRPYEGIAFQFSHHTVGEDGTVEHRGEFLDAAPGTFPNYDFLRALRDQLTGDGGTIFRYAAHENTYLNHIWEQMQRDESVTDRDDLCAFILAISKSKKEQIETWCGDRNMVDMLAMVKRFYYHPDTNGSNSIKHVLPAVLNSSDYLKAKYSEPYYSRNFPDGQVWVQYDDLGRVVDPYKILEPPFKDASPKDLEMLLTDDESREGIREGGAAMAAYAMLQFEDMTDYERGEIERSLRRYCELDTLAMVMIYEAWREMVK